MSVSDLELLRHIKEEVDFVLVKTSGKDKETVINDEVLCRAVVRSIEIIGEASKRVSEVFRSAHAHVEEENVRNTR